MRQSGWHMLRRHDTALLAQDRVPNLVAHVLDVVRQELHVMIPGDTFVSEVAPRYLRVMLAGRAGLLLLLLLLYRNGPRVHHLSLQSQKLGLVARRGPSLASGQSGQRLSLVYARAGKLLCTSPVTLGVRRIYSDYVPYAVPLLARAGVLLCEPPETVGKATWAGLRRRLG
jgi:hypothetical protein